VAIIQVSGISVFAQADISSLSTPVETIVPNVMGFLPGLDGQRRIAVSFTVVDSNNVPHPVVITIDYRDEIFEQQTLLGQQKGQQA
jgi:hypothetical protein